MYLGLIVLASWLATWLGVVAFVALTLVAVAVLRGGNKPLPPANHVSRALVEDTRRILVVANETLAGAGLLEEIVRTSTGVAEDVLVVCPTPYAEDARDLAEARLAATLDSLAAAGVNARGEIGGSDPLQALEDALRSFSADAIVISTRPVGRSPWLDQGVVEAARARFDVPVTHVIGDDRL